MSAKSKSTSASNLQSFHDPSTFIQRPTSAKTPDVAHILTNIFGEIFTKDVLSTEVIKNLTISSDVDDPYHKRYVQRLKDAQLIKENRFQEYAMLEKHILEARAKAMAYEDRENNKRMAICEDPDTFGVPPTKSFFSHCLDDSLLRENGLLAPSDYYYRVKTPILSMPKIPKADLHLRETIASGARSWRTVSAGTKLVKSAVFNEIEDYHKPGSEIGDDVSLLSDDDDVDKMPFWKKTMRQVSRESAKHGLKKIESRVRYLPNPRLDAIRTGQLSQIPDIVIEVSPETIFYNKYSNGKVYEGSFTVRNISKIAHQVRALPPKSQFFSISLGQYPQGQSIIAPGLSATYNVRFAPDSLCTYEDEILVECSNGSSLRVALVAKRESPSLSIGSEIDCGQALVGQIKVCRYLLQNEGGDGRFVILPKATWPGSTFKTNVSSANNLALYPFEIQPSIFEIHKGGVFALEIIFKPPDVRRYEQTIVITCDNCTTIEFQLVGEGELAEVEYVQQEEDLASSLTESTMLIDEYKDIMSTKVIRFPSLNPNVYTRKRFAIKNKSSASIDYSWIIYKPVLEDNLLQQNNQKKFPYIIDKDAFFSVAPKQGTLDRQETKVFEIMFSPSKVGCYNSVAHFVLHGIPDINKQLMIGNSNERSAKTSLSKEDMSIIDFVSMAIELKGECEPFQFTLDPPAVYIPGSTYMQTTQRKAFRLINMSICPINFNWKQVLDQHVIQVEPSYGEIAPKSYALMEALITGTKPGKLIEDIPCYIEFAEEPIYLHVEADIKGPEAVIQEAGLDFGLVEIGDISKSYITIENISNLALKWTLSCSDNQEMFEFPPEGSLQPLEALRVEIVFKPKTEIILRNQFDFVIEDGNSISCNCYAQVQKSYASFLESQVYTESLYLNVEDIAIAKLCNHSTVPTEFQFGNPEGRGSQHCKVRIEPSRGVLKKKSMLEIKVYLTAEELGELTDLRLPCYVKDMEYPIFIEFAGIVKGVSVNYYLSGNNDPFDFDCQTQLINCESKVDFGNTKVGKATERSIIIQNNSGINTRVRLNVKQFKTVLKYERDEMLFNDPMNKSNDLCNYFKLSDATLGLGFVINQPEFELAAFGSAKCSLTALSEIWGTYTDYLYINCDGKESTDFLNLGINVTDSPIRFFSTKIIDNNEEIPMMRFGSQTKGTGMIKRSLKLQNTCSIPVQIDWRVFVVETDDKRLIDLNVVYDDINEDDLLRIAGVQKILNPTSSKLDKRSNNSTMSHWKSSEESNDPNFNKFIQPGTDRGSVTSMEYYDSAGYVYVEQLPLVKINLTPHYGDELDDKSAVFFMNNTRTTLKPRQKTALDVCFTADNDCRNYEAIFVGYLNILQDYQKFDGCERKVHFEKEPVRFKVTGQIDSPSLDVEFNDELHFDVAIGDLIKNQSTIVPEEILTNQFSLLNTTLAPIEFDLQVSDPFYFQNFVNRSQRYSLKPKDKLKVDVLFKFNSNFIQQIDFSESKKNLLEDSIIINYSKDIEQHVPISARILAPELASTKDLLDFGNCLVGQERTQQLIIRNPSSSALIWSIKIENNEEGIFSCDKANGFMNSNKFFIMNSEETINVSFTAKHNQTYNTKLVIDIEPSIGTIQPLVIELNGSGTYDQKAEAVLDI